jgi:hypothetical protein
MSGNRDRNRGQERAQAASNTTVPPPSNGTSLRDGLMIIFTFFIALAGVIYTCYAIKQWRVMSGQLAASIMAQRAFVSFQGFETLSFHNPSGKLVKVSFFPQWKNNGITPTVGAKSWVNSYRGDIPANFDYPDYDESGKQVERMGSNAFYPSQAVQNSTPRDIDAQTIADIKNGRQRLYFYGWATYRDIFSRPDDGQPGHITMFCFEATKPREEGERIYMFLSACPKHNCTDDQCKSELGKPWSD